MHEMEVNQKEGIWILKISSHSLKKTPRKKAVVVKNKDKEGELEKNGWMVKYYTWLL
jgi:hypothetical protein